MKHDKIGPHHLERKAILYVRQSSAHQVLHNRESSTLQYAMRERLSCVDGSCIASVFVIATVCQYSRVSGLFAWRSPLALMSSASKVPIG